MCTFVGVLCFLTHSIHCPPCYMVSLRGLKVCPVPKPGQPWQRCWVHQRPACAGGWVAQRVVLSLWCLPLYGRPSPLPNVSGLFPKWVLPALVAVCLCTPPHLQESLPGVCAAVVREGVWGKLQNQHFGLGVNFLNSRVVLLLLLRALASVPLQSYTAWSLRRKRKGM